MTVTGHRANNFVPFGILNPLINFLEDVTRPHHRGRRPAWA